MWGASNAEMKTKCAKMEIWSPKICFAVRVVHVQELQLYMYLTSLKIGTLKSLAGT